MADAFESQHSARPWAESLPTANTETAPSFLWFATIQCIESKQDLAGLAPKGCFIPAKPVERVAWQIGQTQKTTRKVGGGIWSADITGDIGVNWHAMPIYNKGVLHSLARIDAVPVDFGLSRLGQDCIAGQFCAVVANNRLGLATRGN